MLKKSFFYVSLISIVAFLSSGFKPMNLENFDWFYLDSNDNALYSFPSQKPNDYLKMNVPFTGRFFIGYKEAIAFKESQGKYGLVNSLGYMGKYQFGMEALRTLGIQNSAVFLSSPKMQECAFVALLSKNKWDLKEEIKKYSGTIVGGVRVTESGILAAAHLGGVGSVKRFLNTDGERISKDNYGASVKSYMRDFGGYETDGVIADSNARVR